ncbi:pseudouridine-5'-phosphate glycosidase [Oricola cellulosilytica]|uniref:Pseudouridine-5'-phosphate glycosidase n=1 Tax=Oricola cellulosilytica TaxID=1429082 RepID=A0A4R0PB88_9HYPH|nr:pseudouridine-5'-phosphate glycosidase [Oricola cellulosilytica]TCD14520.1 pseudouridine-5'-phosphate glycosidase [Oricola cellulosilytica]
MTRYRISDEVAAALADGEAVVALESTIITHGMPHPDNLAMGRSVESEIRSHGAVPATIAVIEGTLHVGLDAAQAETLAQAAAPAKLSRADLAFAMERGLTGGTTVAATMMAAHLAGIEVFATGGIGGAHRGAENSFDVSADLDELARTPVTVVCTGAKAILDLDKTLEILETRGVPVVAFRQNAFPAFWSRHSGREAPLRLDRAEDIAGFMATRRSMPELHHGGVLIANPVPASDEIPLDEMSTHIEQAVDEAAKAGVTGKAVTPWLLGRILEITEGRSLKTNIALVENNARLAADIAVANAERRRRDHHHPL